MTLAFDAFAAELRARLDLDLDLDVALDAGVAAPEAVGLFDDLQLDSFQAFELLIAIETMAGLDVPPEELPVIFTLGDAYDYYLTARERAAAQRA